MKIDLVKSKTTTILLTSAGGLTGVYLSKYYNENSNYRIIGVDMSEINPLSKWVDVFYKVPPVKDKNYLEVIKDIILKEKIDILIPVTSYDVDFFSRANIQEKLAGIRLLTMDYDDHIIMHDKYLCYKYLEEIGISVPLVYKNKKEINYPSIIKPREGSGSTDTIVLHNNDDFKYWSKKIDNSVIMEYLKGKEYTVDCLFDDKGKCLGANVRERVHTSNGGVTVTKVNNSIKIDTIISKLEKTKKIKGPINFQFKILENGELCIFDFNTRFASGGLPATVRSGFDIPNKLIQLLLGKKVEKWTPPPEENGLTMVRYYEECFMYEND